MEATKEECKALANSNPIYGRILELFDLEDSKTMLTKAREIIQNIRNDQNIESNPVVLKSFVHLFFKKNYKGSKVVTVRRLLSSFFNRLPAKSQIVAKTIFIELTERVTRGEINPNTPASEARECVDILASLLENFPLGEDCVRMTVIGYTSYLTNVHDHFIRQIYMASSPVELNEAMHHCLVTEQLMNRMMQKCFDTLKNKFVERDERLNEALRHLLKTSVDILKSDHLVIDCRCNAAITLTFVLRICCAKTLGQILQVMIGGEKNKNKQTLHFSLPDPLKETNIFEMDKQTLSTTSYLCLLFGVLSILDSEYLILELAEGKYVLTELFLNETLLLVPEVTNPASKVVLAKLINLWTMKAFSLADSSIPLDPKLAAKICGGSDAMSNILDYVWTALDDSLDVVRQNAKSSFDQLVKTHVKLTNSCSKSDKFVINLIKDVLGIPWCKRGKYPPLSCLVSSLGTEQILLACPHLTACVIGQLDDHTLACYCSEFYEKLYKCHKKELRVEDPESSSIWLNKWVDPILDALCSGSKRTKMNILQYILPKLMSTGNDILQYIISYLSRKDGSSDGTLGALLMCLRRGRSLGLLDDRKSDSRSWCGIVSVDVLEYALSSLDEQIRLDAYSLLCENKKTTEAIKSVEFKLVKIFIPTNLNNQSPSFRQNVSSYTKKFLVRLRDSENSLLRQLKKVKTSEKESKLKENLIEYEQFLTWLQDYLFSCLYFGAAFATRTSALNMLSNMVHILESTNETRNPNSFLFFKNFEKSHVYTLMECLCDTFEENKTDALNVLKKYFSIVREPVFSVEELKPLFKTCMKLSVSVRPQDSTVSAYLALCLLKIPRISEVINSNVLDLKVLDPNQAHLDAVVDSCPDSNILRFLQVLVLSLQDQTEVAKKRLILAAANRPIYPTIHCMRYILGDTNLEAHSSSKTWKEMIVKLVNVCLDVAVVVSPVVQDSSPEGNVPEEAIRGPGLDFGMIYENPEDRQMLLDAEESEKTVTLMPEYLVVCCWRSIKEVSLLLGEITKNASIEDKELNQEGLLSFDLILEIGEYFINQLLASKHRGAFELAYAGFVLMCERLWRSPLKMLHQLPVTWLMKLMADIKADDGNSGLCSTRRSAGIPFYVQALLTTEPPANEQKCFHQAMKSLLDLAISNSSLSVIDNPPKVHALNILRVLFKDNRLGDFVAPYISDGLTAAILGFKSNYWAVRNSSTLLLSALMVRVFGVKVSKDDSELSRKNCLTGRAFFHRFPKVYNFLLKEFETATQESQSSVNGLELHPSLYPVLMVLGRLFPSAMEGADSNLNLAAFIPLVMSCASSPVYKTRIMAARAIQPLVEKDRLSTILVELIRLLPQNHQEKQSFNHLHGVLLQIKFLLEAVLELSPAVQEIVGSNITRIMMDYTWILTTENKCAMTVEVAFEVGDLVLSLKYDNNEDIVLHPVYQHYIECLKSVLSDEMKGSPGSENCRVTIARLAVKYLLSERQEKNPQKNDLYIYLLNSDSYEVRITVLGHLLSVFSPVASEDTSGVDAPQTFLQVQPSESTEILRTLFTMAVYKEWHFECIGQVFEVLASFPNCVKLIPELGIKKDGQCTKPLNQKEIFLLCLNRLQVEGRISINCAILKFLSKFVPHFYEFTLVSLTEFSVMMSSWCRILKQFASTENDADLQLAVAEVLLDNAEILLVDTRGALEGEVLNYWQILLDLLQEDDLDVKEVASKVLRKLDRSLQGDFNPACALQKLLQKMIHIHWRRMRGEILVMLLKLLKGNLSHQERSPGDDRLFDKGEMNTYRDELSFAKLVAKFLLEALQMLNSDLEENGQDLEYLLNADAEEMEESESCENTKSLKGCVHLLKEAFDHTSAELHSLLRPTAAWNLSTIFEDGCSYSEDFNELGRSLLFLMCYDESLVKSGIPHVHLQPLKILCDLLLDNSCQNYCISHVHG